MSYFTRAFRSSRSRSSPVMRMDSGMTGFGLSILRNGAPTFLAVAL